jgi:hypothetical protein
LLSRYQQEATEKIYNIFFENGGGFRYGAGAIIYDISYIFIQHHDVSSTSEDVSLEYIIYDIF